MKRYKQIILSNFFIALDDSPYHHLVEANLDIESRDDRTLCTEVLHGEHNYTVLTNDLLPTLCPICTAILIRRINNMPQEVKPQAIKLSDDHAGVSAAQLPLLPVAAEQASNNEKDDATDAVTQFELAL